MITIETLMSQRIKSIHHRDLTAVHWYLPGCPAVCQTTHPPVCMSAGLPSHLSMPVCPSACQVVCTLIHLLACLLAYLSACLPTCLSTRLPAQLPGLSCLPVCFPTSSPDRQSAWLNCPDVILYTVTCYEMKSILWLHTTVHCLPLSSSARTIVTLNVRHVIEISIIYTYIISLFASGLTISQNYRECSSVLTITTSATNWIPLWNTISKNSK